MSSIPLRLLSLLVRPLPKVECHVVCCRSTGGTAPEGGDLSFGFVKEDRLDDLARLHADEDFDPVQATQLLAQGQLCFTASRDGGIVAYAWLCQRMTMFDAGLLKPQRSDVYCRERIAARSVKSADFDRRFYDAMLWHAEVAGWQSAYRIIQLERQHHLRLAIDNGWRTEGAVIIARGWRSSLARLTLNLGNVYPIRLVEALEGGPPPEPDIGWRELAWRSVKRPFQWLRHGVFHLRLLNLVTLGLSMFGHARLIFIYRRDLRKPLVPCEAKVPITLGWATEADAREIADLEQEDEKRVRIYENRLRRGDRCCVARLDGKIVGTNWIRFGTAWSWTDIRVENGDIYMTDAYTPPRLRGKGIHPVTNYKMLEWAQDQGYSSSYSILDATNANSWIVMANLGWELTGVVITFKPRKTRKRRFWCVSGSPYPMLIDGRRNAIDAANPVD